MSIFKYFISIFSNKNTYEKLMLYSILFLLCMCVCAKMVLHETRLFQIFSSAKKPSNKKKFVKFFIYFN